MEESMGAQYAIQIAVHTLRDRCKNLQQRIVQLEEENVNLRIICSRREDVEHSLTELDKLRVQVTELGEQKDQLQDKIKMVTNENQDLWKKLGKLVSVNKNLGEQLHKINETVTQHSSPQKALIRSRTFTQEEPHTKFLQKNLELNEKISIELENVSLKLTDSFSKQKQEFEKICSEIAEIQNSDLVITEQFGFCFDDQMEEDLYEEFKYILEDFKALKSEVIMQKELLRKNLENVEFIKNKGTPICKTCDKKSNSFSDKYTSYDIPKLDKSTEVSQGQLEDRTKFSAKKSSTDLDKICPICSRCFSRSAEFSEFQQHVEEHFLIEDATYEVL